MPNASLARSDPASRGRRGPVPRTAPLEAQARRDRVREVRALISPLADVAQPAGRSSPSQAPATAPGSSQLSDAEMEQVVARTVQRYGPILDISQAAEVSKLVKQTIRQRVCDGRYADSVVRGRPLRFRTHRFSERADDAGLRR
jgi:hypothetical protein